VAEEDLQQRTKSYALRIIRLVESLPPIRPADVIGKQLLRAGTAVGANYRAARRSRSPADFIAKLGIVEEEADECLYWMELLVESGLVPAARLESLRDEGNQILAIIIASIRTGRSRSGNAERGTRKEMQSA
jgi:four helix bundle protein